MTDEQKIEALCKSVRVLWWNGVRGDIEPSLITDMLHLLTTCEEPKQVTTKPTDEESVDF